MQVSFKLKEVQMAPRSLDCIMNIASRIAADGTRELASYLKINMKVQLLFFNIKIDRLDVPRLF